MYRFNEIIRKMTPTTKEIKAEKAPAAIGLYSQSVKIESHRQLPFVSGQLPLDFGTGKRINADIRAMTHRVIDNIEAILKAGEGSLQYVVRVDIFLKNLKENFSAMNEEYDKRFNGAVTPSRQTVEVSELLQGSPTEISCIAYCETQ